MAGWAALAALFGGVLGSLSRVGGTPQVSGPMAPPHQHTWKRKTRRYRRH